MANPATQYQYVAGIDFDSKNLRVKAGQPLPDKWQYTELVRQLRKKYGEDSVVRRIVNFQRGAAQPGSESEVVPTPRPKGKH